MAEDSDINIYTNESNENDEYDIVAVINGKTGKIEFKEGMQSKAKEIMLAMGFTEEQIEKEQL
jgi:hypothetical protein